MYLSGKRPRNVHGEDKKMRGHSNVTMCEWLINSFFTFCDWMIYIQRALKAEMLISKYRKMSPCISGELQLFFF